MNQFHAILRLASEPQLRYSESDQTPVCRFYAIAAPFKPDDPAFVFPVKVTGEKAQKIADARPPVGTLLHAVGFVDLMSVETQGGAKNQVAVLRPTQITSLDTVATVINGLSAEKPTQEVKQQAAPPPPAPTPTPDPAPTPAPAPAASPSNYDSIPF